MVDTLKIGLLLITLSTSSLSVAQPDPKYSQVAKYLDQVNDELDKERERNDSLSLVITKMSERVKIIQRNVALTTEEKESIGTLEKDLSILRTKQDSAKQSHRKETEKMSIQIITLLKEIEEARIKRLEGFRLIEYFISLKLGELTLVFGLISAFAFAFYRLGIWVKSIRFDIEKSNLFYENQRLILLNKEKDELHVTELRKHNSTIDKINEHTEP